MKTEAIILAAILFTSLGFVFFQPIQDKDAIDAIVGEASNQTYDTMVCIAQAIRHRGTLKGVYGFHALHNKYESVDTYEFAGQAWEDSTLIADQVRGAKNFGTLGDLEKIYRQGKLKGLPLKARCGDFYFY